MVGHGLVANVCILTFNGIGNILGVLPILSAIQRTSPLTKIFLPRPVSQYARSAYDLCPSLTAVSFYPTDWYKLTPDGWGEFRDFLFSNNISVILNWRNDGYLYKAAFNVFREYIERQTSIVIHDVSDLGEECLRETSIWEQLLAVTRRWIPITLTPRPPRPGPIDPRIHVLPFASRKSKRLSPQFWIAVVQQILRQQSRFNVSLHEPLDDDAMWNTLSRHDVCKTPRVRLSAPHKGLPQLRNSLDDAICCLNLDSYPMHLAAYLGIPHVTCFVATDPRVWSHRDSTVPVGRPNLSCANWRWFSGNCMSYYFRCSSDCEPNEETLARHTAAAAIEVCNSRN